jgi:hypothetical protein
MISNISYLFISKAIVSNPSNINLYRDRLLLLSIAHDPLKYTALKAIVRAKKDYTFYSPSSTINSLEPYEARDALYQMEYSDLALNPILYEKVQPFKVKKDEFDKMIRQEHFLPNKTTTETINTGIDNHKRMESL